MQAIVVDATDDYRLEEVEAGRICAHGIKTFCGVQRLRGNSGQLSRIKAAIISGYELMGHAVKLGENVTKKDESTSKVRNRLISEQIVSCRKCRSCMRGEDWMYRLHNIYGF